MLCWEIGRCLRQNILQEKRAAYGKEIVAAVWQQLGWTHFKSSIPIGDPVKRKFYTEMCRIDQIHGFLEAATLSENWIRKMGNLALVLEAHHTTHIEGTRLTLEEVVSL